MRNYSVNIAITDTKLYAPVVILSTQDSTTLMAQWKLTPRKLPPEKLLPRNFPPENCYLWKFPPLKSLPPSLKIPPLKIAPKKITPRKLTSRRLSPMKVATIVLRNWKLLPYGPYVVMKNKAWWPVWWSWVSWKYRYLFNLTWIVVFL